MRVYLVIYKLWVREAVKQITSTTSNGIATCNGMLCNLIAKKEKKEIY